MRASLSHFSHNFHSTEWKLWENGSSGHWRVLESAVLKEFKKAISYWDGGRFRSERRISRRHDCPGEWNLYTGPVLLPVGINGKRNSNWTARSRKNQRQESLCTSCSQENSVKDIFVNPKDWLIERSRETKPIHPDVDPTPRTIETVYSDFRKVDGILRAFQDVGTEIPVGKTVQRETIQQIESNVSTDPSLFTKPSK